MSFAVGFPVTFANHAIERYRDRLRPALSIENATAELEAVSAFSVLTPRGPAWMSEDRKEDGVLFLEIGDAAFPLVPDDDGGSLVAKTCLVKGSMSPEARDRRNRDRQATCRRATGKKRGRRPRFDTRVPFTSY